MNQLYLWANRWGVPPAAISDLITSLSLPPVKPRPSDNGQTETDIQNEIRLEASEQGARLWRNNVGVAFSANGKPIRFGLANDSARVNEQIKSSDLIGIRPGGQFIAREVKRPGWSYSGTTRETAQLKFITLIQAMGGDACFAVSRGTI